MPNTLLRNSTAGTQTGWKPLVVGAFVLAAMHSAQAETDYLTVVSGQDARAIVDDRKVLREEFPERLFGFNVNHFNFQQDLWSSESKAPQANVTAALKEFKGALYRYPGGLVSNRFWWQEAVGPVADREPQKAVKARAAQRVEFGLSEFTEFVNSVGGQQLYVLNLVGWDSQQMFVEFPAEEITQNNAQLARYRLEQLGRSTDWRWYQLGNELDRAEYQMQHEKYVQRSKATIDAIREQDEHTKFIAFLRDFDWVYKNKEKHRGRSDAREFARDVLEGLPEVNDISLHFYYDDPESTQNFKMVGRRLSQFARFINDIEQFRPGQPLGVWVTEHARGVNLSLGGSMSRAELTSNHSAALSTADFLIGVVHIPQVKGAAWHGLNAGPWQLFDASISHNDLRPRPVYWGLRVLRIMDLPLLLGTTTVSPNFSGYNSGYDIRAATFASADQSELGLWVVNRATRSTTLHFQLPSWSGRPVSMRHFFYSSLEGANLEAEDIETNIELDPESQPATFDEKGELAITLPPGSVSTIMIAPRTAN